LFCLGLSLERGISVLLEHLSHRIPGPAEGKTSIPVKISRVQPDLKSLLYHVVHITCGHDQDGGATEIDGVIEAACIEDAHSTSDDYMRC